MDTWNVIAWAAIAISAVFIFLAYIMAAVFFVLEIYEAVADCSPPGGRSPRLLWKLWGASLASCILAGGIVYWNGL